MADLKFLFKQKQVEAKEVKRKVSPSLCKEYAFLQLVSHSKDVEISTYIKKLNSALERHLKKKVFSSVDPAKFLDFFAPQLVGFAEIKKAALMQLFAKEKVHLLLLGDPGTGKTEILRTSQELAPIASFGLGSGTTGAGLTVTVHGKEVSKGLLPLADKGICCIDELNLLKKEDLGSLYNAMEKGFVTYSKGGRHLHFDARVRVLATANPKGDTFADTPQKVKQQLPFEQALLSRFHLIFFIKKPSKETFMTITKHIMENKKTKVAEDDAAFIKDYVMFADGVDVDFPLSLESKITSFVDQIKDDENKFLIRISPRLVVGLINLCKAHARMYLRSAVTAQDIDAVLDIVHKSLYETY